VCNGNTDEEEGDGGKGDGDGNKEGKGDGGNSNGDGNKGKCWQQGQAMATRVSNGGKPHKNHNLIYKIYNVAQRNVLLLVRLKCYV
jgi:hypothetical protein